MVFSLCRYQAHLWYTDIHTGKTFTQIKIITNLKLSLKIFKQHVFSQHTLIWLSISPLLNGIFASNHMTNHIVSCRLGDLDLESLLNHKLNSLDWISHASRDAPSTQYLMFRFFRRSGLGFALWRLCFFGAHYVTDFKKQCLLPACQPANQP